MWMKAPIKVKPAMTMWKLIGSSVKQLASLIHQTLAALLGVEKIAQTRIFESKAVKPNIIIPLHFSSSLTQLLPRHLLLLHSNLNQKVKQALTATPGCYPNHSAPSTSSSRIFSGRNPDSSRYLDCLYFLKGAMLSLARFPVSSEASLGFNTKLPFSLEPAANSRNLDPMHCIRPRQLESIRETSPFAWHPRILLKQEQSNSYVGHCQLHAAW